MSETNYEFVKGEGWVLGAQPKDAITLKCGTMVRVVNREPHPGERWCSAGWFVDENVSSYCQRWKLEDFPATHYHMAKGHYIYTIELL